MSKAEVSAPPVFATPASLESLEFSSLLRLVAGFAATDLGREAVLALRPETDEEPWLRHRRQIEEMQVLLDDGSLVPSWEEPLEPLLSTAMEAAEELGAAGLLELARLMRWAVGTGRRVRETAESCPQLAGEVPVLSTLEGLGKRIAAALDERGRVRDNATPRLSELGRRVRGLRRGLYAELESRIRETPEAFSEDTVTLHEGRLVLLLQSGARGRVQGVVHGRSGTGQSFYFEPLRSVEANNRFRDAIDDEEEERRRIVRELVDGVVQAAPDLRAVSQWLARFDALQSACRYGETVGGRLADLAEHGDVQLVGATHPLLDPRLRAARQRSLGQPGHDGEVVPLDLELSGERRMLVITGPNAGGKTVALKTLGIAALAHQAGLPIPAKAGTRLPLFERIIAQVGDEQDLLADRSTFSGRLMRLGEAWDSATGRSLVLLDELGSGTDPEEGAALAIALAEELSRRGAVTVITTHLVRLAMQVLEWDGASCGAMAFDRATGTPTFRLVLGPPGGSEAIALARRLGLASHWLQRAEAMVDSGYESLLDSLRSVEEERSRLQDLSIQVEREKKMLANKVATAEREAERLRHERERLAGKLRAELDAYQREVRQRLDRELEALRRVTKGGKAPVRKAAEGVSGRVLEGAPEIEVAPPFEGDLEVGTQVRHRRLGWEGTLEALDGARATVRAGSKRIQLPATELVPVALSPGAPRRERRGSLETPEPATVDEELNLIGEHVEPALARLESYIDRAVLAGRQSVRIVHGHGTGRLKAAVREWLRTSAAVDESGPAPADQGGDGATIVRLRD